VIKGRKGRQNFVNKSNQFCQDILDLEIARPESLANLVMALSSYESANHPVELSESVLYPRKYHNVYRSIQDLSKDSETYEKVSETIRNLCMSYGEQEGNVYDLQTDVTGICKAHSPCLKNRMYIKVPNNVIASNKPVSKGYNYSFVNLSLNQPNYENKQDAFIKASNTKWSAPVIVTRVSPNQTAREVAIEQVKTLFDQEDLPFSQADLVCNTLDSYYGNAGYLSSVHHHPNLVNIVRLRGSIKIYPEDRVSNTGGTSQIYGACHYLIENSGLHHYKYQGEDREKYRTSVLELPCSEKFSFQTQTGKGKLLRIEVRRINNMMLRSKKEYNMKDKPFDLLYVRVFDEEKRKNIFKPMWLAITGQKRKEITSLQAYCKYSHRYDIEPFFRFSKQKLLLDKYQTSKVEYLDNWVLIVQMASWLLWTASDEAKKNPKPWQAYLPEYKTQQVLEQQQQANQIETIEKQCEQTQAKQERLTIAQTRKGAETLFSTFDKKPFAVQKSNKGNGREKGMKLDPRKRYKVVKKDKNLVQKRAT